MASEAIEVATTVTGNVAVACPAAAVIVARPAATAVSRPSDDTRATLGAALRHVMRSARWSPAAEYAVAVRTTCWPRHEPWRCGINRDACGRAGNHP